MSDPTRLTLEPSSEMEAMLLQAGRARAPEAARRRALVLATAALAGAGVAAGSSSALAAGSTVVKGASAATLHWIAIVGLVGAGAATAAVALGRHDDVRTRSELATTASQPAAAPLPKPVVHQAPAAPLPSASPETPATSAPATARPPAAILPEPAAPTSEPSTRIGAELSTLDQARAALSAGNHARALSILDDYAMRFPHASMASEATVLRIEALVRAGDPAAARRVADAFLSANPGSPYADRVRSLVGANP
ncbi:MAG TPA: hypothetical protein VF765_22855 [Polyangiaceae bacterium]